jgi:hypothetical protein
MPYSVLSDPSFTTHDLLCLRDSQVIECGFWTSLALLNILPSIRDITLIFYVSLYLNCLLHIFSVSMSVKYIILLILSVRVGQFSSEILTLTPLLTC